MVYRQLPFLKFWEKYNRAYLMEGEDLSAPVEIEFCTGSFQHPFTIYRLRELHKPLYLLI